MYIIIIGCGILGSNLAKELSDDGNDVCIIDRNGDKLDALGSGFNGQRIKGIEFDSDILLEAGIEQAEGLLAVTPDDNINITVSLIADKIFQVPKIIARVNNPEKKFIFNNLGINIINPIQNEIEIVKSMLPITGLEIITTLDNKYEIIELLISKNKSITVNTIEKNFRCIISGVMKEGIVRFPDKEEELGNGDRIICTIQKNDKVKLINHLSKEIFV